tara:strand:+ start:43 stop:258 length:216 start_codon:yes stop_codon:yes gene_type:complete
MNLCYIFTCERRPPSEEEMKGLKEQAKKASRKSDKIIKKEDEILEKEDQLLDLEKQKPKKPIEEIDLDNRV